MNHIEWLSKPIYLNAKLTDDEMLKIIFGDFLRLVHTPLNIFKQEVKVASNENITIDSDRFKHFVEKGDKNLGDRFWDYERATRIWWIKDVTINCTDSRLMIWKKQNGRYTRTHILLKHDRYLLVLENRNTYYFVVTAYYIHNTINLGYYVKEYRNYKKTQIVNQ